MRLGTRGSALALAQAEAVADALGDAEVVTVRTSGDRGRAGGDKARFVREIERALLDGEVDLGVHSAKDVPTGLPDELQVAGVPEREDPSDAYVGEAESLADIPDGALIGTASLRRRAQLLAARSDLRVTELRGNVDTRLERLRAGDYDGIVLAAAGLRRLGRDDEIAFRFQPGEMTPAPGQGALALEARRGDAASVEAAASLSDETALLEVIAERAAVAGLGATCHTPVGINARLEGEVLQLDAFIGLPDGSDWIRDRIEAPATDPTMPGHELASRLVAAGGREILQRAEEMA
jgi:hydroxymethylbilane synthase